MNCDAQPVCVGIVGCCELSVCAWFGRINILKAFAASKKKPAEPAQTKTTNTGDSGAGDGRVRRTTL